MGQSLTMFKTITLCLLVTSSLSLPAQQNERGFFIDVLGGLVAGDGATTAAPAESTTMATLYGDLVNIFNLIFPPASSTTSAAISSTSSTTTSTTTTTTTTTTPATTTTTPATTTTTP